MATDADNDEGWGGDFRKHVARSKCTEKESADGFLFSWAFSGRGGGSARGARIKEHNSKCTEKMKADGSGRERGMAGGRGREHRHKTSFCWFCWGCWD